jgi:hypothetical protein
MSRPVPLPPGAFLLAAFLAIAPAAEAADYVIHISVDGLRADLLQNLIATDPAHYGNFKRFIDEGATTFNARTDFTHTITLPNHTSMVTGRPVLQPTGQPITVYHGYTDNSDPAPTQTLHNSGNLNISYKASVFDVVHDHGLSTAHYASKTKFVLYDRSFDAAHGAPDATGADNGTDKIDAYVQMSVGSPETAANMNAAYVTAMGASHFRYSFVHYVDADAAGHSIGWGSATWNTAVQNVDGYLGALFNLVENDPVLANHTVIILSADHGGSGTDHSVPTNLLHYRIPFLVWGAGVAHADLYALNTGTRLDPGTGRPDYNAAVPPIRNGDGGNLALSMLGLPPIPGSTINASQNLRVSFAVPMLPSWAVAAVAGALAIGAAVFIDRRTRLSRETARAT